jgi:hypothetical protein
VFARKQDEDGTTKLVVPNEIDKDSSTIARETLGQIIAIALYADWQLITVDSVPEGFWTNLAALSPFVKGAYYYIIREEYEYIKQVPTTIERGWNYAQWQALKGASKGHLTAQYILPKQTNYLVDPKKDKDGKMLKRDPILSRVEAIISEICTKEVGPELKNLKKYFRSEGFFLEKFCGKKPVKGLYTEEELAFVQHEWETRHEEIKAAYAKLPNSYNDIDINGFIAYTSEITQKRKSEKTHKIEEQKAIRIKHLLVDAGRGKDKKQVIAKGDTLPQKLIAAEGGPKVTSIATVMWSPLSGIPPKKWISYCMAHAKAYHIDGAPNWVSNQTNRVSSQEEKDNVYYFFEDLAPSLEEVSGIYDTLIDDMLDIPSWKTAFGSSKKKSSSS